MTMRSPSFIIRSSCGSLSKEGEGREGESATVEPVISFPVLEVLPYCWAVRAVNRDKGIAQNKVTGQSKHTVGK